jgi:transcriptional/translational regulatory protein YebC/TACO1
VGLFRKSFSACSAGLVSWNSPREKQANAAKAQAKAYRKMAKAQMKAARKGTPFG